MVPLPNNLVRRCVRGKQRSERKRAGRAGATARIDAWGQRRRRKPSRANLTSHDQPERKRGDETNAQTTKTQTRDPQTPPKQQQQPQNSDDPKDRERRALADLIYSYSLARPAVHPFFWGVQWSGDQKARWLDGDRLHLTPAGHQELGRQVALAVRREMGADPCGAGCAKFAPAAPAPPPRFAPDPSAEPQLPAEPRAGGGGGGFGISMGGMNLLDPMGIISGSASAVGSFIPLPNLGALGAVLPGFRGFGIGLPSLSMAARAARGQQCGGAGLACVAFSYFCVDAPFPNVACGQGVCTRLSEW